MSSIPITKPPLSHQLYIHIRDSRVTKPTSKEGSIRERRLSNCNRFIDTIYTYKDSSIKVASKLFIYQIVDLAQFISKAKSEVKTFKLFITVDSKSKSLRKLLDYLAMNEDKAALMTLDAYGNAGLLTRMDDNHSFNEYETNYLAFNCYRLEGLNKPQHSAVTQPVHQNITKKRSHDSSQDSQEDYMTDNCMEDVAYSIQESKWDESSEILKEIVSEDELLEDEDKTRKRLRAEHDVMVSNIEISDANIQPSLYSGRAPNLTSITRKCSYQGKFGDVRETDENRIQTRIKQILFGKNTTGYDNYVSTVPKEKRHKSPREHPRTPDPHMKISKRGFDGIVKAWRRSLHEWDDVDKIEDRADDTVKKYHFVGEENENFEERSLTVRSLSMVMEEDDEDIL